MCLSRKPSSEAGILGDLVSRYALPAGGRTPPGCETTTPERRGSARRKLWDLGNHAACPVTGVCWAVLTHARCTPELEFAVLGQVHMLQHQVGMAARVDQTRLQSLVQENQKLGDELILTQQRLQTATQEQAQRNALHEAERMQLRGELIRAQTAQVQALAELDEMKRHSAHLPLRQRLVEDNQRLLEHNQQLRRALNQATQAVPLSMPVCAVEPAPDTSPVRPDEGLSMHDRAVLCVGGRTRVIPVYRELIEDKGARFLHHDGGEEDKAGQLGPMLQSADLVICQVGCISHNAYWRVKEHCKRHGKPCLFVETPSRSALERVLSGYSEPSPAALREA